MKKYLRIALLTLSAICTLYITVFIIMITNNARQADRIAKTDLTLRALARSVLYFQYDHPKASLGKQWIDQLKVYESKLDGVVIADGEEAGKGFALNPIAVNTALELLPTKTIVITEYYSSSRDQLIEDTRLLKGTINNEKVGVVFADGTWKFLTRNEVVSKLKK